MALGDVVGVDNSGNQIIDMGDGSFWAGGINFPSLADAQLGTNGDLSMTTQSPSPTTGTAASSSAGTTGIAAWLKSAGEFGVSIAGLLSGQPARPQTTTAQTLKTTTQQPFNVGGFLLLAAGVLILVKVLS